MKRKMNAMFWYNRYAIKIKWIYKKEEKEASTRGHTPYSKAKTDRLTL